MADYYIGIDGGGSKTCFLCTDINGVPMGTGMTEGAYCAQDGIETVIGRLKDGIAQCLPADAGKVYIGFGMPAYGENKELDEAATAEICRTLAPMKIRFENDVVLSWASALAMEPGVAVVGGTGSIGYGRDSFGNEARCGGWHEFMSDEGSGYWLGRKLLRLFSKESDGRLTRTPLYELTRTTLGLKDDFDINALACTYAVSRRKTAALQKILLEAAREGDPYAIECYEKAAVELSEIIIGVIRQLRFGTDAPIRVSYSGGLFQIEDLITDNVAKALEKLMPGRISFANPVLSPCEGAVMLAMEMFGKADFLRYREKTKLS